MPKLKVLQKLVLYFPGAKFGRRKNTGVKTHFNLVYPHTCYNLYIYILANVTLFYYLYSKQFFKYATNYPALKF
jgi:hypothetical protein